MFLSGRPLAVEAPFIGRPRREGTSTLNLVLRLFHGFNCCLLLADALVFEGRSLQDDPNLSLSEIHTLSGRQLKAEVVSMSIGYVRPYFGEFKRLLKRALHASDEMDDKSWRH